MLAFDTPISVWVRPDTSYVGRQDHESNLSLAIAIAIGLIAWLGSGQLSKEEVVYDESIAQRNIQERTLLSDQAPTQVRVVRSQAQTKTRLASVRGKTENKRTVQVRTSFKAESLSVALNEANQ